MTTSLTQRFTGKVALLTGAGSGIGQAVARRLATEGAVVHGLDIDADALDATAADVRAAGGTMHVRRTDVAVPADCRAAVADCLARSGRLDVLGNIAGIASSEHVLDITDEHYRRMMAVNVDGYFFMAQAALPHLLESGGNIVNIASNAGLMGIAYSVVYSMTKGAVVQLTRSLAMEFVKTPLRVNAIAPAGVRTNLTRGFTLPENADFELMKPYVGFRGAASPDDIAALFAFVASDEAANMHGAILASDGGVTAG
jgi:meso-butanediol dehydrogenase/(S,S)-butanediol dehydrogenase/diacetyl reductase